MNFSKSIRTLATSLLAAATLSVVLMPTAANASIFSHKKADSNMTGQVKTVHFNLRNDSAADIDLRAGDQAMTVAKGKTTTLNLAVGTRITRASGDVVCEVSTTLANNTVVVK